jgi:two-component system NtrC family sensor kinase
LAKSGFLSVSNAVWPAAAGKITKQSCKWQETNGSSVFSMLQRDKVTTWALVVLLIAAFLLPAALLAYGTWINKESLDRLGGERSQRTLDVLQEHAQRVFAVTERIVIQSADLVVAQPGSSELELHLKLADLQTAVPEIQSIWAFNEAGNPIVSSTIYPVPSKLDNSDRQYFQVQAQGDAGFAISENISAKIGNFVFFVISKRLPSNDDRFKGILAVTVSPENLNKFYEKLARGMGLAASLLRPDGSILARYPLPDAGLLHARTNSTFQDAIQRSDSGSYSAISGVDELQRRISYRKVDGYPLYIAAALDENIFRTDLISGIYRDLAFSIPIAALLAIAASIALKRTRLLLQEFGKREKAEAALKQAQRLEALGQLTGGVAHDFNNLLMVIQGSARRLQQDLDEAKRERATKAILAASYRGESLVKHLLSFSRQQTIRPDVIKLDQKVSEMTDMLRTSLRGNIELKIDIRDNVWPIQADVSEFELALLNIAVNARDAMSNGGRLEITARNVDFASFPTVGLKGEGVQLCLSDNGSGISAQNLSKVFEPFYTTKEVGKGTGLGLSQVYGFAKQANGAAHIESTLGKGTTVSLFFPRSSLSALSLGGYEQRSGSLVVQSRLSILVVDDNADILSLTTTSLAEQGHQVLSAPNGERALELLGQRRETIDVVFSDIVMPGAVNGVQLAREVRKRYPDIPVVLASGYSVEAQKAAEDGVMVLKKPYRLQELNEALINALSGESN